VKWSVKKDEPVNELLGNINESLIQRLLERKYGSDVSSIPTVDYLAPLSKLIQTDLPGVIRTRNESDVTFQVTSTPPNVSSWLEYLAGQKLSWLRALICSNFIVRSSSYIDNPLRRVLAPRVGQKFVVKSDDSHPSVTVYGAGRSYGEHLPDFKALEILYSPATRLIDVVIYEERCGTFIPLSLQFEYKPSQGFAPIHEIAFDRNKRIKQFYWKLWYGDSEILPEIDVKEKFVGSEVTISADAVEQFCVVVGNQGEFYQNTRHNRMQAPMDFAIVTGWQVNCIHAFYQSIHS